MAIFTGAGVALITPMNDDGSVNYEKLRELLEFHVANKTDAIIICGTTGESSTMPDEAVRQATAWKLKNRHREGLVSKYKANGHIISHRSGALQ